MAPLAIVGARLLDARSEAPIDGDIVVVGDGGRIASIGSSRASIPGDATILDAGGRTVVPGLIDCHVHLFSSYEALHDTVRRSYSETIALMLDTGRRFLEQGVTSARDAGFAPAGIKRVFARGEYPGPRLQVSVMPLSITGGHADGRTPSGVDLNQGLAESELPLAIADGPDAVRVAVRRQIGAGADWIKVMATGGVYSLLDAPEAVQFTVEEIRVMVEEAADAGAHGVLAHAENARGIKNAVRAGVRSIEHGEGLDEEAAQLMVERDVALVPTFLVGEEMLREDRVASGITPPWAVEKGRELLAAEHAKLGLALQHGVRIAMGTDGGHDSHLPSELSLLVEHGMTPLSALRAATVEAARLLGLEPEIGTLEPGKRADLILLDFDPLTEPASWRDPTCVSAVVKDGRIVVDRSGAVASQRTSSGTS